MQPKKRFLNHCGIICNMFDQAYIDFDHTLFNTAALSKGIRQIFLDADVPEGVYEEVKEKAVHGEQGNFFNYSFEHHIALFQSYGYHLEHLLDSLHALIKEDHSFDDTYSFLDWVRVHTNQLFLLTAGNPEFQLKKIATTRIAEYVDDIIICHHKKYEEVLARIDGAKTVLFVNDNLKENYEVKEHLPNVFVITKRQPMKNSDEELSASGIPYVDTLDEIKSYLNQI